MIVKISKILIIIQRSNGDVFLSSSLINVLYEHYNHPQIDLLVNDDTLATAKTLNRINKIHLFSYKKKKRHPFIQEINMIKTIYKKYDLSINLTASDRSVIYAILASRFSISAIEKEKKKSWWKKLLLTHAFVVDPNRHILEHNRMPLKYLAFAAERIEMHAYYNKKVLQELNNLSFDWRKPFIIFHPLAQYNYKIYPKELRNRLLEQLNKLDIPIAVTGGKSAIGTRIAEELPKLDHIYNLIGQTSLSGFIALCDHSVAYIGMDTLNMHIAAALNKRIFAILGPTLPQIWSPWCNELQCAASTNAPVQIYGNVTLFQADMPCVACGKAGCDDKHGESDCLKHIAPETIYGEVNRWLNRSV